MRNVLLITLALLLVAGSASAAGHAGKTFESTPESLKKYDCPAWFRDAKFGIYLHWGAYSVAEQGEPVPEQVPALQVSVAVQNNPSLQAAPFWAAASFWQVPELHESSVQSSLSSH